MFKPFSKRQVPPPSKLRSNLDRQLRLRLMYVLETHCQPPRGSFNGLLNDVKGNLLRAYGGLASSAAEGVHEASHLAIDHFLNCDDNQALDFLEFCVRSGNYTAQQLGVDEINSLFDEVGLAYQLTPFAKVPRTDDDCSNIDARALMKSLGIAYKIVFPQIIRRDSQMVHKEVIEPSLKLLRNPRLAVANDEFRRAHAEFRDGKFPECITLAGSGFESVLKTICMEKGWAFDQHKDTLGKLVDVCYANELFPSFYVEPFKNVGTVRNSLSASHGRGPTVKDLATKEYAANMLHLASSHILLLCELAGMR